jgi:hypothetical protein
MHFRKEHNPSTHRTHSPFLIKLLKAPNNLTTLKYPWCNSLKIETTTHGCVSMDHTSPHRDESCESVFAYDSFMHQKCSNYALTNLLFSLWRSMQVIDLLVTLPSPLSQSSSTPFYPRNVVRQGMYPNCLLFRCVHLGLTFESIKELGSASHRIVKKIGNFDLEN